MLYYQTEILAIEGSFSPIDVYYFLLQIQWLLVFLNFIQSNWLHTDRLHMIR
jgi:hypothetical protein